MSNPGAPRQTLPRKAKNSPTMEVKAELESEEVSSTSLDQKVDELPNGTAADAHNRADPAEADEATEAIDNFVFNEEFRIPARSLPAYNTPEKIIIVYDSAVDEVSTGFSINNEAICPTLMLKRSLRFFLCNKHLIDTRHEYALIVINDNGVVWLKDFTNQIEAIIQALEDIPTCETEDILQLDDLFKLINDKVLLPNEMENINVPPPYVVRVLFTYGRSYTMPKLNANLQPVLSLVNSPYFTFDILMTHEMPSARNNCIKIFKYLQHIDCKGFSYFLPVGRSASELHFSMAILLGHPLQRSHQQHADYTINVMET